MLAEERGILRDLTPGGPARARRSAPDLLQHRQRVRAPAVGSAAAPVTGINIATVNARTASTRKRWHFARIAQLRRKQ